MTITVYQNTSARNVVDKSLTQIATYQTAQIKDVCSIADPVITVSNTTGILSGNYLYIPDFNRYYFINKIETEHQRIIIYAHVDVLMTYAAQLRNMSGLLARVQDKNMYNLYLNDKAFKTLQYKDLWTEAFRGSDGKPVSFTKDLNFVLVLAGGERNE